jgi:5-formyltetrahydrofolate cyclo-ligase
MDGINAMTDSLRDAKAELRQQMREHLQAMSEEDRRVASNAACARLVRREAFRHASTMMLYMSVTGEIDATPAAIRAYQLGRTVCVPRFDWDRGWTRVVEVTTFDDHYLETDEHGVRPPRGGRLIVPETVDLVVVPGLAFDARGHRLGRGDGYYDRFLARLPHTTTTIGLCFDSQIVDNVPVDETDRGVDLVVTDRRVTRAQPSRSRH